MQEEYQQEINDGSQLPKNSLNKGQKIAVAVLAVFAVLVFGMWASQFRKSISEPFEYKPKQKIAGEICEGGNCGEQSEDSLRAKDTDGDGLSDWDELYFYNTSPYLEDSDSDGYNDKQEIDAGKDPNCPAGRDCYGADVLDSAETENKNNAVSQEQLDIDISALNDLLNQSNTAANNTQEQNLQQLLSGQSDASTLRAIMIEAGVDEEMLNQISDEDLMKSYRETLGQE